MHADTAPTAAAACFTPTRAVVVLAESSHPELEPLVLPSLLRSAMLSLVQVRLLAGRMP